MDFSHCFSVRLSQFAKRWKKPFLLIFTRVANNNAWHYIYIYMCVCVCVCVYTYIYTHLGGSWLSASALRASEKSAALKWGGTREYGGVLSFSTNSYNNTQFRETLETFSRGRHTSTSPQDTGKESVGSPWFGSPLTPSDPPSVPLWADPADKIPTSLRFLQRFFKIQHKERKCYVTVRSRREPADSIQRYLWTHRAMPGVGTRVQAKSEHAIKILHLWRITPP